MLRKAQFPSVASGSALRSLLAKADPIAEVSLSGQRSTLCRPYLALEGSALQVDVSLRLTHHDNSDLAEVVLLVCRSSPRPGARGEARSVSR